MRRWAGIAAALLVAGCGGTNGGLGAPGPVPAATAVQTPSPTTAPASATTAATPTTSAQGKLPDLIGKGLQVAQDDSQAAGFQHLTSHDALGRGRTQLWDRNWRVCFQSPAAGKRATDTTVDLGAVKLEEGCPKTDKGANAVEKAGDTMPDFAGKSLAIAEQSLGGNASLSLKDGTGDDRTAFLASDWKVCSQKPKAGAPFGGVPVTLTIVKFGEDC